MKDKISVLMPAYNREKYIKAAILSILQQTHKNLELIVYDDGSNDKTVRIVQGYAEKDRRVRLVIGKINHGVGYARNRLLNEVRTKYACWQDSDDMSNVHRLEIQLRALKESGMPLVFANYTINQTVNFLRNVIVKRAWLNPPVKIEDGKKGFATTMFEVAEAERFNPRMSLGGEDWGWLKEIQDKYGDCPLVPQVLYYIRFHDDRIGVWKRKLASLSGFTGVDCSEGEQAQSYREMIEAYKRGRV